MVNGHDFTENNEFDGFITKEKNHAFAIKTADCIPLIIWDEQRVIVWIALWLERFAARNNRQDFEENKYQNLTKSYIGPHISKRPF